MIWFPSMWLPRVPPHFLLGPKCQQFQLLLLYVLNSDFEFIQLSDPKTVYSIPFIFRKYPENNPQTPRDPTCVVDQLWIICEISMWHHRSPDQLSTRGGQIRQKHQPGHGFASQRTMNHGQGMPRESMSACRCSFFCHTVWLIYARR